MLTVSLGVDVMTVSTVDTDIVIYSLFFCSDFDVSLYIEIGVAERRRAIDVTNIIACLGKDVCLALLQSCFASLYWK